MFTLVQVSDTHATDRHGHFSANLHAMARAVRDRAPDLLVNTGDLSMDGASHETDLATARAWHEGLGLPYRAAPGNHDVGDTAALRPDQPVTDERLRRWRGVFGPDRWTIDREAWRLIGLNVMLLGTGHPEEEAQFLWLEESLAFAGPIAVFLHKPLFIDRADEPLRGYWNVAPGARRRVLDLLSPRRVRLVASGHLHVERRFETVGTAYVFCPAASFVVHGLQEELGGIRRIGFVEHTFEEDGVTSRFMRPDGVEDLPIDPVVHELYPPAAA